MQQLSNALADRYTLVRELGRGGMATVYLARDLKHERNVALKVLDAELGAVLGAERFLAEIKVTANLQHPNLLPLFDSGEAGGLLFYTMPFVDGESLRAKLEREKQLSIDEALRITTAIAGALDYAHRHGVIHRDLKPENILLADGQPLLADFGIALAVSNAGGSRITQTGLSLGTPQYMSPEQATGDRSIDGRTDIYSLGAILFEMLTGDPPYVGSTAQAVIARVLTEPPRSVRAARNTVPESIDRAVERALAKLPADRFATAHEFASALRADSPMHHQTTQPRILGAGRPRWASAAPWIVASAAVVVALASIARPRPSDGSVVVSTLLPPPNLEFSESESMGAMSPDGTRLAFVTLGSRGETQLWVRRLDVLAARAIPGTDGALAPFWSPDGKSIGYFAQSSLNVADAGGAGVTKHGCLLPTPYSGSWSTDGTIAIASDSGIIRASATGRECRVAIKLDSGSLLPPRHVWLMPDDRHVLFTSLSVSARIMVGDLQTGSSSVLAEQINDPTYVAPGILLFGQGNAEGKSRMWARRFDARRMRFTGDAVPVTGSVRTAAGVFSYAASDGTALAYLPGRGDNGQIITDRSGRIVDTTRLDGAWMHRWARAHPWIVALTSTSALVKIDVERRTQSVLARTTGQSPVWSPADSIIAQGQCGLGAVVCGLVLTRVADGHDSLLVKTTAHETVWPSSWSSDGRYLVYTLTSGYSLLGGTWVYDFTTHAAAPAIGMRGATLEAAISPDNGWLAYRSNETDTWEVYVRPFERAGEPIRVSTSGGRSPVWNANGRELFFEAPDGYVMVSDVQLSGARFSFSPPRRLILAPAWSRHTFFDIGTSFDVSPDGQRFAFRMSATGSDETGTALVLVQNWRALLK